MAKLIYTSVLEDVCRGNVDFDTDTFKMLLVNGYTADKSAHTKRSSVTSSEVANGNGYTTGGVTVACTVAKDATNNLVTLTFAAASWSSATISATGGVIYKSRGGASSADELVGFVDFNGTVSSTGGTFSVSASVLTLSNA